MVASPRPPIWIMSKMIAWPAEDQYVPVSTSTSPVTQVAEVEVKSVTAGLVHCPLALANGKTRSRVPDKITTAKEATINRIGFRRFLSILDRRFFGLKRSNGIYNKPLILISE